MITLTSSIRCSNRHLLNRATSLTTSKLVITNSIQGNRRNSSMFAWKVADSLDNSNLVDVREKLNLVETKIPTISLPSDVLVKVHSTSINPLDVRMVYGYGRRLLDLLDVATNFEARITNDRYPLTLGRDFSGEVVAAGPYAQEYKPGDLVFGAVEPQRSGAHAQYVTAPSYCLSKKPQNLNHNEAASIPFVALTAYSALSTFGNLSQSSCNGKRVLVIGGSGGVGSFAIQLLKLWGANVVATCSEEKIEWLENTLFVDQAICHDDPSQMNTLNGRFDFVLDCGAYDKTSFSREEIVETSLKYLIPYSQAVYVTLSPPVLSNIDNHGLILGAAGTILEAACDTLRGLSNLNSARWAFFLPDKRALDYVASLYEDDALTPQVSSVFKFNELPNAYEELQSGNVTGKVVIAVSEFDNDNQPLETSGGKSDADSATQAKQ